MLGLVIGSSAVTICFTSAAPSATPRGTAAACCSGSGNQACAVGRLLLRLAGLHDRVVCFGVGVDCRLQLIAQARQVVRSLRSTGPRIARRPFCRVT